MSQVLVWKSDHDGKLFEDKKKYQIHLRKAAAIRATDRKIAKMEIARSQFLIEMGQVSSISDLTKFIKDNWDWFYTNGQAANEWRRTKRCAAPKHAYFDVSFKNMKFGDPSNSHSCPTTGVTNWSASRSAPGTPTSYPGWQGSIHIKVKTGKIGKYNQDGYGSDYFNNTMICTGGGGGGHSKDDVISYSYDVILWADDFPGLVKHMDQENMWEDLGGQIKEKDYAVY
jgi:hypothetical protein